MSDAIIFRELPATFPEKDKYQKPSVIGSVIFHGFLIVTVILVPLLLPQSIPERELLVTLVSPVGVCFLLLRRRLRRCPRSLLHHASRWKSRSGR